VSEFLADMIASRTARIAEEYGSLSSADLERIAAGGRPAKDFGAVLRGEHVAVIAEVKKASPSAGPIAPCCEASKQALHYERGGAAAISVLTEPEHFGGAFTDLSDVADAVEVPVLAKDFVVDQRQLFVARGHGADAVLLMVSVLGTKVAAFLDVAQTLGLQALVEVHDEEELEIALSAQATIVGVNSRDLRTLEVDPEAARAVVEQVSESGVIAVAESGIKTRADVEAAAVAGVCAVLVGEVLMRSEMPEETLEELTGVARLGDTENRSADSCRDGSAL
jgi:indole-3-glycerol phosphate synthase